MRKTDGEIYFAKHEGEEIVYPFVILDDPYGLVYVCFASEKRLDGRELKKLIGVLYAEIKKHGSPGVDLWCSMMEKKGFRALPSMISAGEGPLKITVLPCVPPPAHKTIKG